MAASMLARRLRPAPRAFQVLIQTPQVLGFDAIPASARAIASSRRASAPEAPRIHVQPLDGTSSSLEQAVGAIRSMQPKQVMLETCEQRRQFAEQRAESEAKASATATTAASGGVRAAMQEDPRAPLSHADAISAVQGGLGGSDVVAVLREAEQIGAQVYTIDRPYQDTQNLVARHLLPRPSELLAFARFSAASLVARGEASHGRSSTEAGLDTAAFRQDCPGLHRILVEEREKHMASEVSLRAVPSVDVLVCCTSQRAESLKNLTASSLGEQSNLSKASRASRLWPVLLLFAYLLIPAYGSLFLAWRLATFLGDQIASYSSLGLPELNPSGGAGSLVPPAASSAQAGVSQG